MSYPKLTPTIAGRTLHLKCVAGETKIQFSRIVLGDGELQGQSISTLTKLVHEVVSIPVTDLRRVEQQGYVSISGAFLSQTLPGPFYLREMAVYAMDPDVGEIAYCAGNAFDLATYIDPGAEYFEEILAINVFVGEADAEVVVTLDESLVWSTKAELQILEMKMPKILAGDVSQMATMPPNALLIVTEGDMDGAVAAQYQALLQRVDQTLDVVNEGEDGYGEND